jgi:hypothetical protein
MALALRLLFLERSPLRGDEAFAVRYWAAPPAAILDQANGLAWTEPHPFGTFFVFWGWESLVGSGEIAMRLLPVLVNLLGLPAMYALGKRLFKDARIGLAGALLWAINPNLIWHSQDARNYAIWAALSALSLWLMLRTTAERRRRADRVLYILVTTLALYMFFLEAFMLVAQALYVLIFRRKALRGWLAALLIIALLLIPWFGQLTALAGSGYRGTAVSASGDTLWRFYGVLAFGETLLARNQGGDNTPVILCVLYLVCLIQVLASNQQAGTLLGFFFFVPLALLTLAATRLNVFNPRYVIASTPALLLPWAYLMARAVGGLLDREVQRVLQGMVLPFRLAVGGIVIVFLGSFFLPTGISLANYYSPLYRKAPDWYGLRDYLRANAAAADTVIMTASDPATGALDPAFGYYYTGPAKVVPLPYPSVDLDQFVAQELTTRRAIWFVVSGDAAAPVNAALLAHGVMISDEGAGQSYLVRQYRAVTAKPDEIDQPLNLAVGGALLKGYSLTGQARSGGTLTVLLFWEGQPQANLIATVQLLGLPKADGSTLWAQHDHLPSAPGRDVYRLDLIDVPPGSYRLTVGLYNPADGTRVPFGAAADGDSYTLAALTIGR